MSTSWVNRWRHHGHQIGQSAIIAPRWRTALALVLVASLTACSSFRLSYNQGPTAAYWWADRYVDFSETQTPVVRQDLKDFWAWHRRTALPVYATQLTRWQTALGGPVTADQICREFDGVLAQLRTMGEQGAAPLSRWAVALQPAQLDRMLARFDDRNQDFREDHLQGNAVKQRDKRLKANRQRWTDWYGDLTPAQNALVEQQMNALPWNPSVTLEERRWRQADLIATVRQAQSQPAQAPKAMVEHLERYLSGSTPEREAQRQQTVRARCAQFAAMHNTMSADQRTHVQAKLQGYIDDVRALQERAQP
jgi:hypothetical protein